MKFPTTLRDEAMDEAYTYFDQNIRSLRKTPAGEIDLIAEKLNDNDIDAFRHAFVSGVFAQEYGERTADSLGRLNELSPGDLYSNATDPRSRNMDLWNNAVGRKYGLREKGRPALLKELHQALKRGELITDLADIRRYEGAINDPRNASKPVVVLKEDGQGRNELFFDLIKLRTMTSDDFIARIHLGEYPGYSIKVIHGLPTPVSKPDGRRINNLA